MMSGFLEKNGFAKDDGQPGIDGAQFDLKLRLLPAGQDLLLFRNEHGLLCFKRGGAKVGQKAIVISMPKAGTYLIGKLLSQIGLLDLEIHCRLDRFSDYRFIPVVEKYASSRSAVVSPLALTLSLIQNGQFAVGHIGYDVQIRELMEGFARIIAIREARDALVSFMRFEERRLRADPMKAPNSRQWIEAPDGPDKMLAFMEVLGAWVIGEFRAVVPWLNDSGSVVCRFETLMGDDGQEAQISAVQEIACAVGLPRLIDPKSILAATLGTETLTYSGGRSRHAAYWDIRVEEKFAKLGGHDANAVLGYQR